MKLYDAKLAPNCRRVRIFLAEKGIEVAREAVAITEGAQFQPAFLTKNPLAKVPVLELDDGRCLSESAAICEYFEDIHPQPPLIGSTPDEKAESRMWDRRIELELFECVLGTFQHTSPYFKKRIKQIAEYAECCRQQGWQRLEWLNRHLANQRYLAGERFTVADITLLCALDFAAIIGEGYDDEELPDLARWHRLVRDRPSSKA
jgi:glutathione S-transferase